MQVLSSPKLVVLNNQTAVLKAIRNIVYFEVNVETASGSEDSPGTASIDTDARTAPEGIMLAVTPHISHAGEIVLNVRPTITRVNRFVNDPQPELAAAGVTNPVPELLVREMESVLRLNSGQVAVLGGLMQDNRRIDTDGVPLLSDLGWIGGAFRFRKRGFVKTELVIFIRPRIIRTPSVAEDLRAFRDYFPGNSDTVTPMSVLRWVPAVRSAAVSSLMDAFKRVHEAGPHLETETWRVDTAQALEFFGDGSTDPIRAMRDYAESGPEPQVEYGFDEPCAPEEPGEWRLDPIRATRDGTESGPEPQVEAGFDESRGPEEPGEWHLDPIRATRDDGESGPEPQVEAGFDESRGPEEPGEWRLDPIRPTRDGGDSGPDSQVENGFDESRGPEEPGEWHLEPIRATWDGTESGPEPQAGHDFGEAQGPEEFGERHSRSDPCGPRRRRCRRGCASGRRVR